MAERVLIEGNEAISRGAIVAGCKAFFGYPITPQTEILEYMSYAMEKAGGVFLQTECELSAAAMTFGANAVGVRAMTATSSPGFSLMQEFVSCASLNSVPMVMVDVQRGGPGIGTIASGETDYRQATKSGGHGGYRCIVLAPYSNQEMFDLTQFAFHLADKYRMVVIILTGFVMARSIEAVELKALDFGPLPEKDWAVKTRDERKTAIPTRVDWNVAYFTEMKKRYQEILDSEVRFNTYQVDDAKLLLVAYGYMARMCQEVVNLARADGLKVGLFRPISLWPFPTEAIKQAALKVGSVLVAEDSQGQLVEDVENAIQGQVPVHFFGIWGRHLQGPDGMIHPENILQEVKNIYESRSC